MRKKEDLNYYYYKGKDVVILYEYEVEGFIPIKTEYDLGIYELTEELLLYMNEKDLLPCITTDDVYSGYSDPEEIVDSTIQNPENDQALTGGWVRESYAKMDEAHRELVVSTDRYYKWTSERTRFKDVEWNNESIEEMKERWEEICSRYSAPFDGDDISFETLLAEMG